MSAYVTPPVLYAIARLLPVAYAVITRRVHATFDCRRTFRHAAAFHYAATYAVITTSFAAAFDYFLMVLIFTLPLP